MTWNQYNKKPYDRLTSQSNLASFCCFTYVHLIGYFIIGVLITALPGQLNCTPATVSLGFRTPIYDHRNTAIDNFPVLEYSFKKLSVLDGLPHSNVRSLYQDRKGFIWVGTGNGLARYDGHAFTVFHNDFSQQNSLPGNTVIRLKGATINGQEGIWIITMDNIAWFNLETLQFTRVSSGAIHERVFEYNNTLDIFQTTSGDYHLLSRTGIYLIDLETFGLKKNNFPFADLKLSYASVTICEERIFLGTSLGLMIYDQLYDHYEIIDNFVNAPLEFPSSSIQQVIALNQHTLFIGSSNGLFELNLESRSVRTIIEPQTKKNVTIRKLFLDRKRNQLYVPTLGFGVFVYDYLTENISRIGDKKEGLFHHSDNVFIDRHGNLWIGHIQDGLSYTEPRQRLFYQINHELGPGNMVYGLDVLPGGNLVMGNNRGQLLLFDTTNETISSFLNDHENAFFSPDNTISGVIYFDQKTSRIWIGNFSMGLMVGDIILSDTEVPYIANKRHITAETSDLATINGWSVRSIVRDDHDRIWIGTNDRGITLMTPDARNIIDEELNTTLAEAFPKGVRYIMNPDHGWENTLFIIDHRGIHLIDLNTNTITHLADLAGEMHHAEIFRNPAWHVYQQDQETFWLATANTGLIRMKLQDNRITQETGNALYSLLSVKVFHTSEGFPSNLVYRILPDDNNIWLSSERGLIRFDTKDETFTLYNQHKGLHQIEYYFGSSARDAGSGYMFFGGSSGVTWFHPDSIRPDTIVPFPLITAASLFSQPLHPGDQVHRGFLLTRDIPYTDTLIFKHNQDVIGFNLVALKYSGIKENRTAYMLEGFDRDWRFTSKGFESINYTNLNPGTYTLRVRAVNADNLLSKNEDFLVIMILPPWWLTLWAKLLWLGLFLSLLLWLIQFVKNRERIRNEIKLQRIELEKERTIAQKTRELDQIRTNFFTNISHEFRTPLTLIIGPLDKLTKNLKHETDIACQLDMIRRNAMRLLHLINQLLDIQKLEKESFNLKLIEDDIIGFIRKLFQDFELIAQDKQITYNFQSFVEHYSTPFDPYVIEKVVFNILSNAFKFTPAHGIITLSISLSDGHESNGSIAIRVTDSGPGIPDTEKEKVFNRFYRYEQRNKFTATGTGIGLSLSRQLAQLHKGSLTESGAFGQGAVFDFSFPASLRAYDRNAFVSSQESELESYGVSHLLMRSKLPAEQCEHIKTSESKTQITGRKTILAIDDNPDILLFLSSILSESHTLLTANDGKEGLQMAKKHNPDLIISDVTMPHMDGLEMSSLLKGDPQTSHIPIIMLTSRSTQDQELEGLMHGADDYLSKPFNQDILSTRIKNIFSARERWYKKASLAMDFTTPDIHIVDTDREFLEKLQKIVQENISEPGFTTEILAKNMGVSRTLLFKKLKGLLNETGGGFILSVRMKSAAEYLRKSDLNISEVCYASGFSDPKYFTRVFKKHFGITPKDFRNQHA